MHTDEFPREPSPVRILSPSWSSDLTISVFYTATDVPIGGRRSSNIGRFCVQPEILIRTLDTLMI
jgi:hypothetical protein